VTDWTRPWHSDDRYGPLRGLLDAQGVSAVPENDRRAINKGAAMKNKWIVILFAAISVSFGAVGAAAQGPAGAGAEAVTQAPKPTKQSSRSSRSVNPISWVRRSPKTSTDTLAVDDEKLTSNLQAQGLLPAQMRLKEACTGIKDLTVCVAGLHASHNLGLNWNCLRWDLSSVLTGADISTCEGPDGDKAWSLEKAIHNLKPNADAKAEAGNAEKQAQEDLKHAAA
jgi:hypothetical protein